MVNILTINQRHLYLDNSEHGILRPIYDDPRMHYGVNCASLGCPNLLETAFTANNIDHLLDQGAVDFINHPRGVSVTDDEITLSKIYDWFSVDFGENIDDLLKHLQLYAKPDLRDRLRQMMNRDAYQASYEISYEYDWALNAP